MTASLLIITEYCERTTDGFWAEPLNAFTNLGFILAAALLARMLYQHKLALKQSWDSWLLIGLIASIGVGSFLWHTLATPWTEWADVVPITLFISIFLLSFMRRVIQLSYPALLAWFGLFHAVNVALLHWVPTDFLNGSAFYLPPLMALLLLSVRLHSRHNPAARRLFAASVIFALSVVFRSVDQQLCPVVFTGTHFLWHLLVSLTLYHATRVLLTAVITNQETSLT